MAVTRSITSPANKTIKVLLYLADATGDIWNGSALVPYVPASINSYGLAVTGATDSTYYHYNVPSGLPAGTYVEEFVNQAGGSLVLGDLTLLSRQFTWNGAVVVADPSPGANITTVGEARTILQQAARNAGKNATSTSPYALAEQDRAIYDAWQHFVRETRCTRQSSTIGVSSGDSSIDFSGLTGFDPDRIINLWIDEKPPISVTSIEEIIRRRGTSAQSGTPCLLGFTDYVTAIPDKNFSADLTINVIWYPPVTEWTFGDTGAGSTQINIKRDLAEEVVRLKGVINLQRNQPQQLKEGVIAGLVAEYNAFVNSKRGAGGLGARSIRRTIGGGRW